MRFKELKSGKNFFEMKIFENYYIYFYLLLLQKPIY